MAKWDDFPEAFRTNPYFIKEDLGLVGTSCWPVFVENDFPPPSDNEDEDTDIIAQHPVEDRRGNINALAEGMKGLSRDSKFEKLSPQDLKTIEEKFKECYDLFASKLG
eukprot:sb/3477560/